MARPNHVPKFGNWDPNDHVPVVFNHARAGKGGKIINPNDPIESEAGPDADSVNQGALNGSLPGPNSRHQRRASREDMEFGFGMQRSSGGEEDSHGCGTTGSGAERARFGSGTSPLYPQANTGGRLGRKPGSASPAPGTPNRNRPERYGAPLPKFGDWDVNNPAAGEGFTVIFDKARDEKKTGGPLRVQDSPFRADQNVPKAQHESTNWLCGCFQPHTI